MGCNHVAPGHWAGVVVLVVALALSAVGVGCPWWRVVDSGQSRMEEGLWQVCDSGQGDRQCSFSHRNSGYWRSMQVLKLMSLVFLLGGVLCSLTTDVRRRRVKQPRRRVPVASGLALAAGVTGLVADLLYVGLTELHSDPALPGETAYGPSFVVAVAGSVLSLCGGLVVVVAGLVCRPRYASHPPRPYWPYRLYRLGLDGKAPYPPYLPYPHPYPHPGGAQGEKADPGVQEKGGWEVRKGAHPHPYHYPYPRLYPADGRSGPPGSQGKTRPEPRGPGVSWDERGRGLFRQRMSSGHVTPATNGREGGVAPGRRQGGGDGGERYSGVNDIPDLRDAELKLRRLRQAAERQEEGPPHHDPAHLVFPVSLPPHLQVYRPPLTHRPHPGHTETVTSRAEPPPGCRGEGTDGHPTDIRPGRPGPAHETQHDDDGCRLNITTASSSVHTTANDTTITTTDNNTTLDQGGEKEARPGAPHPPGRGRDQQPQDGRRVSFDQGSFSVETAWREMQGERSRHGNPPVSRPHPGHPPVSRPHPGPPPVSRPHPHGRRRVSRDAGPPHWAPVYPVHPPPGPRRSSQSSRGPRLAVGRKVWPRRWGGRSRRIHFSL